MAVKIVLGVIGAFLLLAGALFVLRSDSTEGAVTVPNEAGRQDPSEDIVADVNSGEFPGTATTLTPNSSPADVQEPTPTVSSLDLILSSTFRNNLHDDSPYINTASAELPLDTLLTNSDAYYSNVFSASGGFLRGLESAGQFRVSCEFSHFAYDDPIVLPGQPGASHLHMFFGNTHANANSTYDDIINSGSSTCNGQELNRTAYWVPAMMDQNGDARIPDRLLVYYKSYNSAVGNTVAYPEGMALVTGAAMTNEEQAFIPSETPILMFRCYNNAFSTADLNENPQTPHIPKCNSNQLLEMNIHFQTCWNGEDASNYKLNASYPQYTSTTGLCPESHPIKLPQMEYRIFWPDHGGQSDQWFLSSDVDMMEEKLRVTPGFSIHGDWWGGWNTEINQRWIDGCNSNYMADCADGLLADARQQNKPAALIPRPEYTGPTVADGETLLEELCPIQKQYTSIYSAALCDVSAMMG